MALNLWKTLAMVTVYFHELLIIWVKSERATGGKGKYRQLFIV